MSFVFLVINNKAVVDYNVVQIFKWSKNLKKILHFGVQARSVELRWLSFYSYFAYLSMD